MQHRVVLSLFLSCDSSHGRLTYGTVWIWISGSFLEIFDVLASLELRGAMNLKKDQGQWRSFIRTHCHQTASIRSWWWWWTTAKHSYSEFNYRQVVKDQLSFKELFTHAVFLVDNRKVAKGHRLASYLRPVLCTFCVALFCNSNMTHTCCILTRYSSIYQHAGQRPLLPQ